MKRIEIVLNTVLENGVLSEVIEMVVGDEGTRPLRRLLTQISVKRDSCA